MSQQLGSTDILCKVFSHITICDRTAATAVYAAERFDRMESSLN